MNKPKHKINFLGEKPTQLDSTRYKKILGEKPTRLDSTWYNNINPNTKSTFLERNQPNSIQVGIQMATKSNTGIEKELKKKIKIETKYAY